MFQYHIHYWLYLNTLIWTKLSFIPSQTEYINEKLIVWLTCHPFFSTDRNGSIQFVVFRCIGSMASSSDTDDSSSTDDDDESVFYDANDSLSNSETLRWSFIRESVK